MAKQDSARFRTGSMPIASRGGTGDRRAGPGAAPRIFEAVEHRLKRGIVQAPNRKKDQARPTQVARIGVWRDQGDAAAIVALDPIAHVDQPAVGARMVWAEFARTVNRYPIMIAAYSPAQ